MTMKRNITFLLIALFGAMGSIACSNSIKQISNEVKGDGTIVTINKVVKTIEKITLRVPAEVTIEQGSAYKVTLTGSQNLLSLIQVTNDGTTLDLKTDDDVYFRKVEITITLPGGLKQVDVSGMTVLEIKGVADKNSFRLFCGGMGKIDINDLETSSMLLDSKGMSAVNADGKVDRLVIHNRGLGLIDFDNVDSHDVSCSNSGAGLIMVNATDSLNASVSGLGLIIYRGNPIKLEVSNSGLGKVKRKDE